MHPRASRPRSTPRAGPHPVQRGADGSAIFEATVPPCGFQVYDLVTGGPPDDDPVAPVAVSVTPTFLENDHLRIELDEDGLLSSIYDKSAERQVLAPGGRGNLFQLHPDYPNFYDAWDIDRFTLEQSVDLVEVESVDLVEHGPLRAGIRVTRRFGDSSLTQVIRLDAGSRRIEFDTEVEWHETNRLLKVSFPVDVRSLEGHL